MFPDCGASASSMNSLTPTTYTVIGDTEACKFCLAFAMGCGGHVAHGKDLLPGPVAILGGAQSWDILRQAYAEGRDTYFGGAGYFYEGEQKYYRVTKNAAQHSGSGWASGHGYKKLGLRVRPWRTQGRYILLCPPDEQFSNLLGFSAYSWERHITQRLKALTSREILVYRKHHGPASFEIDLENCWAVVAFTSLAAVHAVMGGVPVFCTNPCAASLMGSSDLGRIETPNYPTDQERVQWASNLAANQWTLKEIESGKCWETIGNG